METLLCHNFKYGFNQELVNYPEILNHLKNFEDALKNRGQVKQGQHHWLELDNNPKDEFLKKFDEPKLIYPEIAPKLFAVYDENGFYTNNKCYIITSEDDLYDLKYIGAILSSRTLNFVFKFIGTPLQGQFFNLSKSLVELLPIYQATPKEQQPLIENVDQMLNLNQHFQKEVNGFKHWIQKEFNIKKLSKKLEKYYKLSDDEFINELKKKKVDINSRKNREYLEREFIESLAIINPLLQEIKKTDNEIDHMVYELYDLTEDEIKIVEDSLVINYSKKQVVNESRTIC